MKAPNSTWSEACALSPADTEFMAQALEHARLAAQEQEVPIGALVVVDNKIVGAGRNQTITHCDATAHAEILALREAARALGNHRLTQATLYTTIEPCVMCVGAIIQFRIKRLVFGARGLRTGALSGSQTLIAHPSFNHRFTITGGVLAEESRHLMENFFQVRR